jgi:hypothetical protein
MAHQNTPAERQMLHEIDKLPLPAEVKTGWDEQIRATGLTEELYEEIRAKVVGDPEINGPDKARFEMELVRLVRQWRMETGAKKFGR